MIIGTPVYDCHQGKDRNVALKLGWEAKSPKLNIENFNATALDLVENF